MLDAVARQGTLKPIRLVLVDRQPIVLQGLKSILGTQQDFDVVASFGDGTSCLDAIRNLKPDVALVADVLPDLSASEILAIAKAEKLSTRLVFFTDPGIDHNLTAAIAAGACSAISKFAAPAAMLRSLRLMAKSGVPLEPSAFSQTGKEADRDGKIEKMLELLTPRERQIARLVSEGMSNKEIARRLDVSQGTVKVHLHNIFQKLEITNRTVLATISWLQRTSGFGALAVAFLAFAIADELKAADANDMLAHGDGPGQRAEHAGNEVWKKVILQHLIVSKTGGTPAFTEKDLLAKAVQATDRAAAMEALRAAEQFLGSKFWKEGGAVGSGTNNLPAHLLGAMTATGIGGAVAPEHQIPQPASNSMSIHGGCGTFAAIAGALIYALNDPQLAQAHESGQAAIDDLLANAGDNATIALAAITHVDTNHAAKSAPEFLARDIGPHSALVTTASNVAPELVQGQAGPDAAAHALQKPDGLLDFGHDASPDGSGRDQLMGDNVESNVHRSSVASKSGSSDSASDVASGPDRLNLAAFGALAWLHLTAAAKSIPPHTLAWIYDPATNQTIVYVNQTDRVLDVGERGLLEFHLQGIVSVAQSDVVHSSEGVAVAATLEQLEQALISATSSDETSLSLNDSHASESLLEAAGLWNVSADEGWSFHFPHARTGSGASANSSAARRDLADTAEESAGVSSVTAYGSSTPPAAETLTSKNGPTNANAGPPSTTQNQIVPQGLETAGNTGRGNSEHASNQGPAKDADGEKSESELGNGVGNGNEHHSQAPVSPPGAPKTAKAGGADHGNAGHSASNSGAEAGESDANTGNTKDGHAQHTVTPGSAKAAPTEMAETKAKPALGPTHDSEHLSRDPDTRPTAETKVADHGTKQAIAADGSDHGQSQRDLHVSENGAAAGKQRAEHDSTEHESNPGELHRDLRGSKNVSATAEQQEKGDGPGSHADTGQSQRDLREAHSSASGNGHAGSSQTADRNDRAAADAGPAQTAAASEPRDSFHFRNEPAEPKHSDDAGVGHGPDILEHGRHNAGSNGLVLNQAADLIGPSHAEQSAFDHATGGEHHLPHDWLV